MTTNTLTKEEKNKISKLNCEINNILGNLLMDKIIVSKLLNNADSNLVNYLCQVIEYDNYIENSLNISKEKILSYKFAQIISNLTNKKLKINEYESLYLKKMIIDINFIKTYVQNIYNISINKIIIPYNFAEINKLVETSKSKRLKFNEEKKARMNFGNNSFGARSNTKKGSMPRILTPSFYPYSSKPKSIMYGKIFCAGILGVLVILLLILIGFNIRSDFLYYLFSAVWFGGTAYFLIKGLFSKVLQIKHLFRMNYVFNNIVFGLLFLIPIISNTFKLNFTIVFASTPNIIAFIYTIFTIILIITTVILHFLNPKINKKELAAAQKELFNYQQQIFKNFQGGSFNNFKNNKTKEKDFDDEAEENNNEE